MAIKDIQEQLIKSEGQSGEFLFKQLETDLNAVYNAGYEGEQSALLNSYWEQARKEFSDEAKIAVKKGKSKEAQEVLRDLETLQKSIAATEEVSSGIKVGTLAMLLAIKPHIEKRITTLRKNENIFKSMKKKAVASAAGAVESFASNLLAPLPFGAGQAIIEKTKGFLGAGKGDKAERQAEQAVSFAGRIERGGPGTGGAAENGGAVAGGGKDDDLGETNEILKDILVAVKPDKETIREEERESDRQHKATIKAMKAGGLPVTAGDADEGGGGGGFLSSFLGSWLGGGKGKGGIKSLFKLVGSTLLMILGGKVGLIAAVIAGVGAGLWALFVGDEDPHPERLAEQAHRDEFRKNGGSSNIPESKPEPKNGGSSNIPEPKPEPKPEKKEEEGFWSSIGFKFKEGGKVPGPKGKPRPVIAHGEEIFFDNESSERMEKVASLLEGTDFKNMEEFFAAGKSSVGFNILMDKYFTSGMLKSKYGGMLKNAAMLFGLAGHGQLGTMKLRDTDVEKYGMAPETVTNLLGKLDYFKGRDEKREKFGGARARNMSELNAMRAWQEISKSMALIDTPEEIAALQVDAAKVDPNFTWDNSRWDNFAKSVADKDKGMYERMTISPVVAGNQLNNAAYDKIGSDSQGTVINAPSFTAPIRVDNNTIAPNRSTVARHLGKVSGEDMDRLVS